MWADRFSSAPESRSSRPGRQAATNDQGQFRITDLPAGEYTLTVSYIGFAPSTTCNGPKRPGGDREPRRCRLPLGRHRDGQRRRVFRARLKRSTSSACPRRLFRYFPERVITSLPNTNIADAVGRLPSVSLERDEGEGKVCADSRHRAAPEQRHHQWRQCAGAGSDRAQHQAGCGAFGYRRAYRGVQNSLRRTRTAMASAETSIW